MSDIDRLAIAYLVQLGRLTLSKDAAIFPASPVPLWMGGYQVGSFEHADGSCGHEFTFTNLAGEQFSTGPIFLATGKAGG